MNPLRPFEREYEVPVPILIELNVRTVFRKYVRRTFQRATALPERGSWEKNRFALYQHVAEHVIGSSPIDYLEFGVWEGASLREWLLRSGSAQSRFFGFDSFRGLPTDWGRLAKEGAFDTKGRLPMLDDARVQIVQGWFQETLCGFLAQFRPQNRIVV